ncbi:MAG: hypothetical protein MZV64_67930 [Ignavibacteriales bacterium]|nr:hypothetical protein [Ignavibacteriales bacterium]
MVALCDVDDESVARLLRRDDLEPAEKAMYEKAAKYRDWRRLFEKEKGIDAVTVSTPDHNHAVIAMAAIKMGKARLRPEAPDPHHQGGPSPGRGGARRPTSPPRWATRATPARAPAWSASGSGTGPSATSSRSTRWTNRPIWPQGEIDAPEEIPSTPVDPRLGRLARPGALPALSSRPTIPSSVARPGGTSAPGALGDMGAHIMDQPFWALDLKAPVSVEASVDGVLEQITRPQAEVVTYEFPANGSRGPVKLTWWDGGLTPPRPAELEPGRMVGDDGGGCFIRGDKGLLMCGTYGENPRLGPRDQDAGLQAAGEDHPPLEGHPRGVVRGHQERDEVDDRLLLFRAADRGHAPGQRRRPPQGQEHETPLGRRQDGVHQPARGQRAPALRLSAWLEPLDLQ